MDRYTAMPKIHKMNGEEYYFDPIRKKLMLVTPEETVRQKVLIYLMDELHVPKDMIQVEVPLAKFGVKSKERADIVILKEQDDKIYALAVIECKAEDVPLDVSAAEQVMHYADELGTVYVVMTNDVDRAYCFYDKEEQRYRMVKSLPVYIDMLAGKVDLDDMSEEPGKRIPFEQLAVRCKGNISDVVGEDTPEKIAVPLVNLHGSLMDEKHHLPTGEYKLFRVIEDKGLLPLNASNPSGYGYSGFYRTFVIEYQGKQMMASLAVMPYGTNTILCVGIGRDGKFHHALQYNADREMVVVGKEVIFEHSGRIAVGRNGSGNITDLRRLVFHYYPSIVANKGFDLGTLLNDRLWYLDDGEETKLVVNLIAYALLRDEYRKQVLM